MAQISLYIDEQLYKKISLAARKKKISLSKWVKNQLEVIVNDSWPTDYFSVFGSLADTDFKRPPQPKWADDCKREKW